MNGLHIHVTVTVLQTDVPPTSPVNQLQLCLHSPSYVHTSNSSGSLVLGLLLETGGRAGDTVLENMSESTLVLFVTTIGTCFNGLGGEGTTAVLYPLIGYKHTKKFELRISDNMKYHLLV